MPGVPRGEALSFEHMAEVAPAPGTLDLDTLPIRIRKSTDGLRDLLIERGPATVGIELVLRPVERCAASLALVRPDPGVAFVFSRERWFGAFAHDHTLFRSGERTEGGSPVVGHGPANGGPY